MRRVQVLSISTGMAVAGLLVAACGATHSATSTSVAAPPAPAANAAAHARIVFVSPRAGARLGSTVHVRIRRSEDGHVRFVLDGQGDRLTGATTIVYRHLRPGIHRLKAELLAASGQGTAATAVIGFRVRRPPPPPPAPTTAPAPAPPPVTTSTVTTPPVTTTTAPAPPPAQTQTTTSAPPPATGIPQNGGGDDDSDNHGAPSDGDGNI